MTTSEATYDPLALTRPLVDGACQRCEAVNEPINCYCSECGLRLASGMLGQEAAARDLDARWRLNEPGRHGAWLERTGRRATAADIARRMAAIDVLTPALFDVPIEARGLSDRAVVLVIEASIKRSITNAVPKSARAGDFAVLVESEPVNDTMGALSALRTLARAPLANGRQIEQAFESTLAPGHLRPRISRVGHPRLVSGDGADIEELVYELPRQLAVEGIATVANCRALGGHGFGLNVGRLYTISFCRGGFAFSDGGPSRSQTPYSDLVALEIGGTGEKQTGGGFFGGGFGAKGAGEGMLIAAALNLLTTRRRIDTVLCLQTVAAEAFLHYCEETPGDLRIRLSPVFTIIRHDRTTRQLAAGPTSRSDERTIDQLTKLAALLEKGLIASEEFVKLKCATFEG